MLYGYFNHAIAPTEMYKFSLGFPSVHPGNNKNTNLDLNKTVINRNFFTTLPKG